MPSSRLALRATKAMLLVLLLTIGIGPSLSADTDCPCLVTANTSCADAQLQCQHGGVVSQCRSNRACPGPESVSRCQCPTGYTGADCSLIEPGYDGLCPKGKRYDDSLLNTAAPKSLQCQATMTPILQLADLQDHRIDVWLDLPHRLANVSLWTRTRNPDGASCGPMLQFFQCSVSDCALLSNTTGRLSTLSCPTKRCSVCTDANCPIALQSIIQSFQDKDTPLTLLMDPSQHHHANLTVTLDALVVVEIPLRCQTGACVDRVAYDPVGPAEAPKESEFVMMSVWISAALILYAGLAGLAVFVNMELRHAPDPIKQMMHDYAHDHVSVAPAAEADAYNLLHTDEMPSTDDVENRVVLDAAGSRRSPRVSNKGEFGLLWHNIGYSIGRRGACRKRWTKPILSGNSGVVKPGEMVAILGASGAGKSTLLDILGGIDKSGGVTGTIRLFGDVDAKREDTLSYIVQDDYNLATMTVWETLAFSARTRLPPDTPDDVILDKVRSMIEELALVKVATTKVGTVDHGGISGGERRRLAIGVELIAEPCVVLADEPTSGLDSFYADVVVRALRRRALDDRCAVLMTIHQPPAHLFAFFDKVLLMCRGGTVAFNGAPNRAIEFLEAETGRTMAPGANPFEFLVEALSDHSLAFNRTITAHFEDSPHYRIVLDEIRSCTPSKETMAMMPKRRRPMATKARQCWLLIRRSFRHCARDPSLLLMYNCVTMVVAFLTGLIFYQLDNTIVGSQNRIGFLFFTILFMSLLSMSSMGHFVLDRILLWRERYAGFYSTGPYFVAKLVVDLIPFRILPPVLYSCIAYWLVGLRPDLTHFLRFVAVLILTNLVSGASVFLLSASSSNLGQANLFGILFFIYSMVFGGLLLNASSTNTILSRLSCTSFINYAYSALMANEFHGLRLELNPKGFGDVRIEMDGDVILQNFGFNWNDFNGDTVVLAVAFVCLTMTTFVVLTTCQRRRK